MVLLSIFFVTQALKMPDIEGVAHGSQLNPVNALVRGITRAPGQILDVSSENIQIDVDR